MTIDVEGAISSKIDRVEYLPVRDATHHCCRCQGEIQKQRVKVLATLEFPETSGKPPRTKQFMFCRDCARETEVNSMFISTGNPLNPRATRQREIADVAGVNRRPDLTIFKKMIVGEMYVHRPGARGTEHVPLVYLGLLTGEEREVVALFDGKDVRKVWAPTFLEDYVAAEAYLGT